MKVDANFVKQLWPQLKGLLIILPPSALVGMAIYYLGKREKRKDKKEYIKGMLKSLLGEMEENLYQLGQSMKGQAASRISIEMAKKVEGDGKVCAYIDQESLKQIKKTMSSIRIFNDQTFMTSRLHGFKARDEINKLIKDIKDKYLK